MTATRLTCWNEYEAEAGVSLIAVVSEQVVSLHALAPFLISPLVDGGKEPASTSTATSRRANEQLSRRWRSTAPCTTGPICVSIEMRMFEDQNGTR